MVLGIWERWEDVYRDTVSRKSVEKIKNTN